jgi:hypothetical protein
MGYRKDRERRAGLAVVTGENPKIRVFRLVKSLSGLSF